MDIHEFMFHTGSVNINCAYLPSTGQPLVLLHGGNARWQAFESVLAELAAWEIYAPDFRGHGKSDWAPNFYRLQDYADDIVALLREKVCRPAHLFGHSLGGIVGVMVAAQYPEGVRTLVVGDAPLSRQAWWEGLLPTLDRLRAWRTLGGGQKSVPEIIESLKDSSVEVPGKPHPIPLREAYGENSPVYEWVANNLYLGDPDMLTAILERFDETARGYEMDALLPAIQCPVLLMQADPKVGGVMTDAEIQQAWPLLARPNHVRLEGVSHILHNENPQAVVNALRNFFDADDGTG